jgi:hypothetical protein
MLVLSYEPWDVEVYVGRVSSGPTKRSLSALGCSSSNPSASDTATILSRKLYMLRGNAYEWLSCSINWCLVSRVYAWRDHKAPCILDIDTNVGIE